MLYTANKTV